MIEALYQSQHAERSAVLKPRLAVLTIVVMALAVVLVDNWHSLAGLVLVAMALSVVARLPVIKSIRQLLLFDGIVLLTVILLPFSVPGPSWLLVAGVEISQTGVLLALMILAKATIVMMTVMALGRGINAMQLAGALSGLGLPERLIILMQFSVRYIQVLQQEFLRLRQAMRCRGFQPRANLHTWKSYGYLFGVMIIRAMERADRIWLAMKARGFNGKFLSPFSQAESVADRVKCAAVIFSIISAAIAPWTFSIMQRVIY